MKEKLIMNRLESIELFSEETLSTMEIRGIIGGDGSAPVQGICWNTDCSCPKEHCETHTYYDCQNCQSVKAVALDCGNGSFKFACDITPKK